MVEKKVYWKVAWKVENLVVSSVALKAWMMVA